MRAIYISSRPSPWLLAVLAISLISLLSGCKVPQDPERTTDQVMGGILKVGALMNPLDPAETEALALVTDALQAELGFVRGDPHNLFAQLKAGQIHIIAGRIPANTPFATDVALTDAIGSVTLVDDAEDCVLAIRKGENRFLVIVNRAIREMAE